MSGHVFDACVPLAGGGGGPTVWKQEMGGQQPALFSALPATRRL